MVAWCAVCDELYSTKAEARECAKQDTQWGPLALSMDGSPRRVMVARAAGPEGSGLRGTLMMRGDAL